MAESPVRIGILLARNLDDLGEWLAYAAAYDAAGADALWVDVAPEPGLDPLALTAALAAVTVRSLLVTTLPPDGGTAAALATIGRLSRGRFRILADADRLDEFDAAGHRLGVFCRLAEEPEAFAHTHGAAEVERWVSTPLPDSRATWRATLVDAAECGTHGLFVPANPRLLDLLRNPDDPDHRRDLELAVG